MADSVLIGEPPVFVEDVMASSVVEAAEAATGDSIFPAAAMQFADLTESGSESEPNGEQQQQILHERGEQENNNNSSSNNNNSDAERSSPTARSSPPPNCAICLSRCKRKCFTDSCMHQFCFKCLCEWSKIKPECPLCKQPFKTIIHNVRSLNEYDRYTVQSTTQDHSTLSYHIVDIRRQHYQTLMTNDFEAVVTDDSLEGNNGQEPLRMRAPFNRFEPYRMELLNYYRRDPDAGVGSAALSHLWRRYVYDRKLFALPVSDILTGNFREWSARFYRDNPAQMHRLMPWINRDIACLLRNAPQNVTDVMQMMHDILPMINIPTSTFRRRLTPFLGERTNHFIHELVNFARSPYDMIGYDRVVQYSTQAAEAEEVDLLDLVTNNEGSSVTIASNAASINVNNSGDSSGNSGSSDDWGRLPRPSTSVIVTNPSATHSFSVIMAPDGSELPGISIRRTTTSNVGSQTVAINLSMRRPANEIIEIDDGDAAANAEVAAINEQTGRRQAGASLPISAHIELQSSDCTDDDECVFVLERKPPHLRTPELVSLDSNSDSDVVFVNEQMPSAPPKTTLDPEALSIDQEIENVCAAAAANFSHELFMGPSTSSGFCSNNATMGKNWKMVMQDARRRGRPKRSVTRAQQRSLPPPAHSSSSSSTSSDSDATDWSTTTNTTGSSRKHSNLKSSRRKRRAARKPKTRKRPAQAKPTVQLRSKRRRKQVSEPEVEPEVHVEEEKVHIECNSDNGTNSSSSSDESSDEGAAGYSSDEANGNSNSNKIKKKKSNSSSNSSSDDDSSANLMLSTLRATLREDSGATQESHQDRKPAKRELEVEFRTEDNSQQRDEQSSSKHQRLLKQEESRSPKRRRRCNSNSNSSNGSSSNSSSNLSSRSNSNSTLPSMSICSPLSSLFNPNPNVIESQSTEFLANMPHHNINHSLIELSTVSRDGAAETVSAVNAIRYLPNALPGDEAHLNIYTAEELCNYQEAPEPEMTLYDMDEARNSNHEEEEEDEEEEDDDSVDVNQPNELREEQQYEAPPDEEPQEQDTDEDNDEYEQDENEDDVADSDADVADSDATDSGQDVSDAY